MFRKLAIIFLVIIQVGCNTPGPLEPTATSTQPPTATATIVPTATATPTSIPIRDVVTVEGDGFRFDVPNILDVDLQRNVVGIYDKEGTLIISFTRTEYDDTATSMQDIIDEYLNELAERGGEFIQGETSSIRIGGAEGLSVDLTGTLFDAPIEGRAIVVTPEKGSMLFGIGVSNLTDDEERWQTTGSVIFQGLLDTLEFIDVQTFGICTVSTDDTYGYTEANPIKVGGGFMDGPARERAYLDNLLGPNGESLSYVREGSMPSGDTILDVYRVTGDGLDVTLYLDEYTYSPLQAPVGFTCVSEFISAP